MLAIVPIRVEEIGIVDGAFGGQLITHIHSAPLVTGFIDLRSYIILL